MPLRSIFLCKPPPCLWLEMAVQRRPLHRDKHPPQEKGAMRNKCEQSDCFVWNESVECSVLLTAQSAMHHNQRGHTVKRFEGGALLHRLSRLPLEPAAGAGYSTLSGGGCLTSGDLSRMKNVPPTGCIGLFWGHVQIKPLRHVKQPETRHSAHRGSSCSSSLFTDAYPGNPAQCNQPLSFLDGVVKSIASLCRPQRWARVRRHQASWLDLDSSWCFHF